MDRYLSFFERTRHTDRRPKPERARGLLPAFTSFASAHHGRGPQPLSGPAGVALADEITELIQKREEPAIVLLGPAARSRLRGRPELRGPFGVRDPPQQGRPSGPPFFDTQPVKLADRRARPGEVPRRKGPLRLREKRLRLPGTPREGWGRFHRFRLGRDVRSRGPLLRDRCDLGRREQRIRRFEGVLRLPFLGSRRWCCFMRGALRKVAGPSTLPGGPEDRHHDGRGGSTDNQVDKRRGVPSADESQHVSRRFLREIFPRNGSFPTRLSFGPSPRRSGFGRVGGEGPLEYLVRKVRRSFSPNDLSQEDFHQPVFHLVHAVIPLRP